VVQNAVDLLTSFWYDFLAVAPHVLELLVFAAIATVVWFIVLSFVDRTRLFAYLTSLPAVARVVVSWLACALAVSAAMFVLTLVQQATDRRFADMEEAQTSSGADSAAENMVQGAPKAVLLTEKTYRRTLSLPPELLSRVSAEGVAVLAPYLTDPTSENVTRLVDSFRRSGRRVIFERDATLGIEQPIKLDSSTVAADLTFVDPTFGGRRTYFKATFDGTYAFHNPETREAPVRFTFPLPTGSGTLSNVRMVVNGTQLPVSDLTNGFVWTQTLPPSGRADVKISYENQGARGWSYRLSGRREPLSKFDLSVSANRAPKFARYTVFPTQTAHSIGGKYVSSWHLENIVTAQDVGLVFSRLDVRELLAKMFTFAPISLGIVAVFVAAFALRRKLPIRPLQAAMAILGFALGLALAGIFTWYMPLIVGVVLGCAIAVVLAIRALGRPFVLPVGLAVITMIAFLSLTNKSALLAFDMTAALLLLVPMDGLDFLRRKRASF
jgi:hypothetical protein